VDQFQVVSAVVKFFIVLVSSAMTAEFYRRYNDSLNRSSLFLLLFQLLFTVTYLFQFLIPILYDPAVALLEKGSYAHSSLSGVTFTLFASFEVLLMSLFSFDVYNPKLTKYLSAVPVSVVIIYTYVYFRYGQVLRSFDGFNEWVSSPQLQLMTEILAALSFLPALVFLMYALKMRGSEKKRGALLSSGFFILAVFVYVLDNLAIQPPNIIIRRLFILVGLLVIWSALRRRGTTVK
jgi:hypothetical protein